jgi:hypothetical protein
LEAQQQKKYAQTTPLDDGVSSLLFINLVTIAVKMHVDINHLYFFFHNKTIISDNVLLYHYRCGTIMWCNNISKL